MKLSLTILTLLYADSWAFQPHGSASRRTLVVSRYGIEETRWDSMEKRTSLSNSGPGLPPGNYEYNFTPLSPVTRDYEETMAYFRSENPAVESRWEEIDTRTSLRNSGPGAPPARYDISFTPLHKVARDYERTMSYYVGDGAERKESRWDDVEKRTSLVNSGAGAPAGNYDYPFTPNPPVAKDYEGTIRTYTTNANKESRWDDIEKRASLVNSGPGALPGQYDYTFTPLAPRARDYENTLRTYSNRGPKESRWDDIEKRASLVNSGPGAPPGQYEYTFTPLAPRGRDYERVLSEYGAPGYQMIQSRWDILDQRTTLSNSGPGVPVGNYDIPFTPLPPVARDYERTISYYVAPELSNSRWSTLDKRTSLSNSGPGKTPGGHGMDFTPTPLPPRTSKWYPRYLDLPEEERKAMLPPAQQTAGENSMQLPGSQGMPLPGQFGESSIKTVEAYNLNK